MDNKELKKKLVDMRNSIQDYLDNLDMDEVDEKGKTEKAKAEKGKYEKEDKED